MANLRIAELDFDTIKQNLKNFLKSQSEFTDYDFEGSALSTLIDILAYNTHYNAYLANMTINEMFLDSAVKRSSAVSIAKHLGYIPRSVRGARANINVQVLNPVGSPSLLTLQRYTPFTTTIDGTIYTFLNLETHVASQVSGNYIFNNIEIVEGEFYEYSFNVGNPGPSEKYEIPNINVDTSTLRVIVQNSNIDTKQTTYTFYENISSIKSDSLVYFIEESTNGRYQVFFGDGIFGKKLSSGNKVIIQYVISNGALANVSGNLTQLFSLSGTIDGNQSVIISVNSNSNGGDSKENITSIKYNAPRTFFTQNRAITADDYKALILSNYPEIQSISAWGGEDNIPPIYGKVIISLKPYNGFIIANSTKDAIKNTLLSSKKSMGILTEFVDPEYIHVGLELSITYEKTKTTISSSNLIDLITTITNNYFNQNLNRFDSDFYLSKLISKIDTADSSIVGTLAKIKIQRRLNPILYVNNSFVGIDTIYFYNRIKPSGISSTTFNIIYNTESTSVTIQDIPDSVPADPDGTGTLVIVDFTTTFILIRNIGTVNYRTGEVVIFSILPNGYNNDQTDLRITAELQEDSYNINANRQQIIVLDDSTQNSLVNRQSGLLINTTAI